MDRVVSHTPEEENAFFEDEDSLPDEASGLGFKLEQLAKSGRRRTRTI
jgi:hypothetical protein